MKRGTTEHPKLLALCSILNVEKCMAVGILELMWHFTAKYAPQGDIGRYSDAAIAKAVDWKRPTGTKGVTPECRLSGALVLTKWLDSDPIHRLIVHDWKDHCDEAVRKFLSRHSLDFVRPASRLPLPLPEPLPEPEPVPTARPLLREVPRGLPNPGCQDFEVRFERLYVSHPKTGFEFEGKARYIEIITSAVMPDATADSIDKTHGIWLEFWSANPSEFVPSLARWFEDKYYLKEPIARAGPRKLTQQERVMEEARMLIREEERRGKQVG